MDKVDFFALLNSLESPKEWGFMYDGNCTDEFSRIYWQRKTASYVLYLTNGSELKEVKCGRTQKDHYDNELFLRNKYGSWAKQWMKNKKPNQ